jgi:tetratricopeptide (TPR) repeat protein
VALKAPMAAPVTEPEALSAGLDFRSEPMLLASAEVVDLIASSWLELDSLRPWDTALAAERVAEAFNDSGNNHYDNGDFDDALTAYGRALQILPAYAWAYCNRAAVFLATDDIAAAIEDYTTAIGYDAADSALYNGRAFALLQRQPRDLDAALAVRDTCQKSVV